MTDKVFGKDTSIVKSTCPTAQELNALRPKHYGGKNNPSKQAAKENWSK